MNKAELVTSISEKAGITKVEAEKVLNATLASISDGLVNGERVQLLGFGSFEVKTRNARKGRNPRNPEEEIMIPAKRAVAFKAGKALKDMINE